MFFVIIFALITTSELLSMENCKPSTISITTVDKCKTYIATTIASKIPLINNLIDDKIYDIEFKQYVTSSTLSFALKSIDCNPQIHKIYKTSEIYPKSFKIYETIYAIKTFPLGFIMTQPDMQKAKEWKVRPRHVAFINAFRKSCITQASFSHLLENGDTTLYHDEEIEEFTIMPKTFQETIALYKTLDYLRFDKEATLTVLRHACFGCPLTESDLEEAKKISVDSIAIEAINPCYDYTSEPSYSVLETKKYGDNTIFSPDGKALASASADNTIKLWDSSTGDLIRTLEGHPNDYIHEIAFSPDGKTLASASNDRTIKLWDPSTGKLIKILNKHPNGYIHEIAFSPDGKALASGSSDNNTINLWDPSTGDLIRTLEGHTYLIRQLTFSPDGKTLASASNDRTIKLWDPSTGKLIRTFKGHITIAFSPDGKTLASASNGRTIKLWDPSTGDLIRTLKGHTHWVKQLTFSPDGKTLASASDDKTIKLWDPSTGKLIRTLEGHTHWIKKLTFSTDGSMLVGRNAGPFSYSFKKQKLSLLEDTSEGVKVYKAAFQELLRKRYEELQTKSLVYLKK